MDNWHTLQMDLPGMDDETVIALDKQVRDEQNVLRYRRQMLDDEIDRRIGKEHKKLYSNVYNVRVQRTPVYEPSFVEPIKEFISAEEFDNLVVTKEKKEVSVREANKYITSSGDVGDIIRNAKVQEKRYIEIKEK